MTQYISIPVFLVSFSVGLFLIYILGPEMKTIYIYPTPENIAGMVVKDDANNCFSYKMTEVECPADNDISKMPFQS